MSVCPFSSQNDFEVQEYNKLRRAYLAREKQRKAEEKTMKQAFERDRRMSLQTEIRNTPWPRNAYLQAKESLGVSKILRKLRVDNADTCDQGSTYAKLLE